MPQSGKGDVLDMLSAQLNLDPETIKLLEQQSLENGVSFESLLEGAQKGKDPQAMIDLLKQQKDQGIAQNLTKDQGQIQNLIKNDQGSAELKNILGQKESKASGQNGLDKSLNLINSQKDVAQAKLNSKNLDQTHLGQKVSLGKNLDKSQLAQMNEATSKASAQKNINNNLIDLNSFMQKQSPAMQANAAKKAYQPISQSLFTKKVDASLPEVVSMPTKETKIQDLLLAQGNKDSSAGDVLNESFSQSQQAKSLMNTQNSSQAGKVFDLNMLSQTQTTQEVISKVQDYILQAKASGQPELNVSFEQDKLGRVDLRVQKAQGDHLNIHIGTSSADATKFFSQNQRDLLGHLAQAGIQVNDFKLESSQNMSNQNSSQDGAKDHLARQGSQGQQHQSQSGQRDQESRKREELWNHYYDQEVA